MININEATRIGHFITDKDISGSDGIKRAYFVEGSAGSSGSVESNDIMLCEKQFLLSAERGDIGSVRKLLELYKSSRAFNINCVDPLGRSALHIAVENENIELIELLLDHNIETGDSILYAIVEENVEAVEIILEHLEKIGKFNPESQGVEINEHSAFTPDITPIILAAHKDNYECIKLFLDKKATILHPHDVRCSCKECLQAKADDYLCFSRSRINAYRALTSPSLICLSSRDPILYAFELSYELRRLSSIENEFRSEYQELSRKCQAFTVNMLEQVRGSKELEIVLNHTTNAWEEVAERKSSHLGQQLARLKLAVKLRQKRFVAHPSCQQLLSSIFYEGLPGFRDRHLISKVFIIVSISFASPLLAIAYLIAPKSSFAEFIRRPFVKFLCHNASYCFFLLLLILASQRIDYGLLFGNTPIAMDSEEDPDQKEKRGPPPTPVEWTILVWVMGLIWVEIKQLWDAGLHDYCRDLWNILDFITNALYLCTFVLRVVAYIQVEAEMRNPLMRHLGRRLQRRYWDAWDPTLISECAFATANIFSSLKLIHFFTVNPHLGPLKISLGRMVLDIVKFLLVYFLVLFSFACGLNQLMWYYAAMRQKDCEKFRILSNLRKAGHLDSSLKFEWLASEDSCDSKYSSCASLYKSMETLFWSSFGIIGLEELDIYVPHSATQWTGRTIFGSYCCISVIVLLNMLIAMMSNSYQNIYDQADIEWKFARSKLWIEYFEDTATLPPPFNMIPSPKSVYYCARWLFMTMFASRKNIALKFQSVRNQKILKVVNKRENNYRFVMRNLVKRYVAQMQRGKQQTEGVNEDDVNEIKQDISAFRYELLGILRTAGFNTGHADINQKTYSRSKKRSMLAERRLRSGLMDSMSIPMPEVVKSTSDSVEADENTVGVDKRKSLARLPAVTLARTLKMVRQKVLPQHLQKAQRRTSMRPTHATVETSQEDLLQISSSPISVNKERAREIKTLVKAVRKIEGDDEDSSNARVLEDVSRQRRSRLSRTHRHRWHSDAVLDLDYVDDSAF